MTRREIPHTKTVSWWHDPGLRALNLYLLIPLSSQYVQGYDGSLANSMQSLTSWQTQFNHPTGSILGLINAGFFIGGILATPIISYVSDKWGRRVTIMLGSLFCIVGTFMQTFSNNRALYIVARFVLGVSTTVVSIGPVLVAELAYAHHREHATALSNTQYSLGAIVAAWVSFGSLHLKSSWAWRLPSLLQLLGSVAQLIGCYFMPESPRWLYSKGRHEECLAILTKYHGNGDVNDAVVQFEYQEIVETFEMETYAKEVKWIHMITSRGARWRTFIMVWTGFCYQLSGNGLVSYYLHLMLDNAGITGQVDQVVINATMNIFSFICSVCFSFLPKKYGRRRLILISLALIWLDFTLITITTGYHMETGDVSASYATVVFIYLYSMVHNLGFVGAIMVYLTEVMPFESRAKGLALFHLCSGAASALNTYLNPVGISAISWKWYIVFVGWIAIEFLVCYLTFIETKGLALEEVAAIFDKKNPLFNGNSENAEKKSPKNASQNVWTYSAFFS